MLHRDRWIRLETPEWTRVEELRLSLLDGLDDGTAWVVGNTLTASVTMRIEGGRVHADEGVSDLNVFVLGVAASDEVLVAGEHGVQRRSPTAQRNARGYVHWERTPLQLDGLDATAIATDAARVDDRWIVAGVTLGNFADGVPVGGSTPWLWNDGAQVPLPAPAMPYSTARLLSSSTLALGSRGRIHMVPLTALRV
jgi:hypothetical protein